VIRISNTKYPLVGGGDGFVVPVEQNPNPTETWQACWRISNSWVITPGVVSVLSKDIAWDRGSPYYPSKEQCPEAYAEGMGSPLL